MKKTISIFMAVVMFMSMLFIFPSQTSATTTSLSVTSAFYETYFVTESSGTYAELTFTIPTSGYYIVQSFGFFDNDFVPVETYVFAEIYSSDAFIGEGESNSGYNQDFFINEYLEQGETYRLYIWFEDYVYFGRLSIVNAANYFAFSPKIYTNLQTIIVTSDGGSQMQYSSWIDAQNAVVFLVKNIDGSLPRNFVVHATCCSCTKYRLVVPYGHGFTEYGGSQLIYDVAPTSEGAPLMEDVLYFLVIYRGFTEGDCPDHYAYDEFYISIEPADLQ